MLKLSNLDIKNVKLGNTQISKIYRGTTLVWENWVYYTGVLFNMTSSTTPSPFVASAVAPYNQDSFKFFNNSSDVWDLGAVVTSAIAKIDMVNPIRILEFYIKLNYAIYDYATFYVEVSNDNTNWTQLWNSGLRNTNIDQTVVIDSVIPYRYLRVRLSANTNSGWYWEKFIITKWYKKG